MLADSYDSAMDRLKMEVGNAGWLRVELPRASVWVQFAKLEEEFGGRFVPMSMFVLGALDTEVVRAIPFGRIEAWANHPTVADELERRRDWPSPNVAQAVHSWAVPENAKIPTYPHPPPIEPTPVLPPRRVSGRLPVPDGRPYPDAFYWRLAKVYGDLAALGEPPAARIAEANEVPTTTAHRWIREARHRGFLPPAKHGKAG